MVLPFLDHTLLLYPRHVFPPVRVHRNPLGPHARYFASPLRDDIREHVWATTPSGEDAY